MNLRVKTKKLFYVLKDLFFPIRCCSCNKFIESEGLCSDCWSKIKWILDPKCRICGTPFEIDLYTTCTDCLSSVYHFDKILSVFEYDDFSKNIILKFKHGDCTYLSGILSRLIYNIANDEIKRADFIVPVPIHFLKRLKRKYNQTELLAKHISKASEIKYEPRILGKSKNTSSQEGLTANKRKTNIVGTFAISEKYKNIIKGKKIILVDDVVTTKATVNECSKILKKNGAKDVTVLTIAMVVKK